ncbi:helix-turn-helix domain-containing protein [Pseudomonas asiatica]|uniref:helix-turn-helix domain-containing protein n=1 Tax=Pseudomonas asiatica TaxID=2219225 RepID=UPI0010C11A56|nr:helix-turn-helix domain-containing protein [Pseudomonas asiatica]
MESSTSAPGIEVSAARRIADSSMQGITRDNRPSKPSDAGWRVRLMKDGKFVADRHFRDLAYHGRSRAKRAAQCYRDDMANEHQIQFAQPVHTDLALQRHAAGLTQAAIASMLAVSPALVSKWEKGGDIPAAARSLFQAAVQGELVGDAPSLAGADIRRIRAEVLGWTQTQLADALGWAYAAVGYWERGQRRIPGWVQVYMQAIDEGRVSGKQ